uniref:SHSP domain-containing protein n=1 Tax=Lotharella oceanica TaxID=641309 RepID=A0A7S2TUS8_9EUKA
MSMRPSSPRLYTLEVAESPFVRRRWQRWRMRLALALSLGGVALALGTLTLGRFGSDDDFEETTQASAAASPSGPAPLLGSPFRGRAAGLARPRIIAVKIGSFPTTATTTVVRRKKRMTEESVLSLQQLAHSPTRRGGTPRDFLREVMRDLYDPDEVFGIPGRSSSTFSECRPWMMAPPLMTRRMSTLRRRRAPPMILTPRMMTGMGMGMGSGSPPPVMGFGGSFRRPAPAIALDLGIVARGLSKIVGALLDLNRRWKKSEEPASPTVDHHHHRFESDESVLDREVLGDLEGLKIQNQRLNRRRADQEAVRESRGLRRPKDSMSSRGSSSMSSSNTRSIPISFKTSEEVARNPRATARGAPTQAQKAQSPLQGGLKTIETDRSYTFVLQVAPGAAEKDLKVSPRGGHLDVEDHSKAGAPPSVQKLRLPPDANVQTLTQDLKQDGRLIINVEKDSMSRVEASGSQKD